MRRTWVSARPAETRQTHAGQVCGHIWWWDCSLEYFGCETVRDGQARLLVSRRAMQKNNKSVYALNS